jgi:hypothetical protein
VRHIEDGVLRRLDDEPLAVPDRVTAHVAGCERCGVRRAQIARDTERAARLFSGPQLVPDVDLAWARLRRELESPAAGRGDTAHPSARFTPRRRRVPTVSLRAGLAIGAIGAVVAGTAAAATLTTIFAPTHVVPVSVTQRELRAIAAITGLGNGQVLGDLSTPNGSSTLPFGTVTWSAGTAHPAASPAVAAAEAGFSVTLPTHLPPGVGAVQQSMVQPRATATVRFDSHAPSLAGSSVTVEAGPGVIIDYAAAGQPKVPTLAIATMRRPTAHSTGASLSEIEAFLLRRPGVPPQLAEEVRLLGDLRTTLPVPVPPGASRRSVQIDGEPGVLLTDSSNAAAAVVWEDSRGLLHAVVGILDSHDVLNVASQLG